MFFNDVYLDNRYPQELGLLTEGKPDAADAQRALTRAQIIYSELKALIYP
jgi:hypothetical protein